LVGVFTVIFAAAMILVFFRSRGEDIGRLQTLIIDFASGSFFSINGFLKSLAGLLIAILIWIAWFGLGSWIEKFAARNDAESLSSLTFARTCALGAMGWSLVWFFLGAIGAYNSAISVGLLIVGISFSILFGVKVIRKPWSKSTTRKLDIFGQISLGLLIVLLIIGLIASLAPPTAKDALLYHLSLPKEFIAQGSFKPIEGNIASFLALGTEMHSVWAMRLGNMFSARIGEAAATATIFGFAPLLILVTYGWARELEIEKTWALMAALLVASVPTVFYVATNSYVDCALALFFTIAIYSLTRFWTSLETRWLIFLALAVGAALSIKLTTIFLIAAIFLLILFRARSAMKNGDVDGNSTAIILKGAGALFAAVLVASPWYLKTWFETGSPLFPFYLNLWEGRATGWDVERSRMFQIINSQYGGADKSILDYLLTPIKISLLAQPEIPKYYDGVLGVTFLVGLPLMVWAFWRFGIRVEIKVALGVCAIVILFWLFSSEQLRYLLPILPSAAIGISAAAFATNTDKVSRKFTYLAFLGCASAGILTSFAWFFEKNPVPVVFGGETRDEFLSRRIDYYKYYKFLNTDTSPETKVWLINMRRDSYHIAKPYFSDYMFENWTLNQMLEETKSIGELRSKVRAMGITHILARHDFLLDFKRSDIVNEKRSDSENREKLQLARELLMDKADTILADARFSLVKLK